MWPFFVSLFNASSTPAPYPLSLHDALPISVVADRRKDQPLRLGRGLSPGDEGEAVRALQLARRNRRRNQRAGLRRLRPGHGQGMGAALRARLDRKALESAEPANGLLLLYR